LHVIIFSNHQCMNLKKEFFFRVTNPFANQISAGYLLNRYRERILIPVYHLVNDQNPSHISFLYPAKSRREFTEDLDFLLKVAKPVGIHEIINSLKSKKNFNTPVFHLTFDDGLREFHDIVAPILMQKGIPATCFLNSDFIDNKNLFHRFKVSILIELLRNSNKGSINWKAYHEWLIFNNLKTLHYVELLLSLTYNECTLIDQLATMLEVDFSEYLKVTKPYMESDQVRSLIKQGFTFGAHSVDHPEFNTISKSEQILQIANSIDTIASSFNLPYRVFSFPFTDDGLTSAFFDELQGKVNLDLTFGSAGIKRDSVDTNLQRIPAELRNHSFELILKKELIYNIFLKMFRKDTITRN
jgi:peptidoglycan/xylan/chitin deacetylase (PgdA/CDA1 family)